MQKQNLIYYFTFISLLIPLIVLQLFYPQMDILMYINKHHQDLYDALCLYGTFLGDGWFIVAVSLCLFFFKPRLAILLLVSYLLSSAITQSLKHFVFSEYNRPLWHLQNSPAITYYLAPGTDASYSFSFPSGHTTSAFAFFGMLYFFAESNAMRQLWMLLAFFTGFTRMYLLQHFLIDVTVGAFIGFSTAFFVYQFLYLNAKLDFIFTKWNLLEK